MEKLDLSFFVKDAREKLTGRNAARMAAIHTGAIVLVGIVLTLVQLLLANAMESATGLSGLGTVSILQTAQTVLQWANTLLVPFWNLGFLYVALLWARGSAAEDKDLLMGFRRIRPCIGLLLNRFVISFCVMFLCVNLCSTVYMMLPASGDLLDLAADAGSDMEAFYASLTQQDLSMLLHALAPLLIVWGILCLVVLTPLMYRFRLAEYVILDHKEARAFPAMLISASLLRRRTIRLFQLDLRFWWYYLLKVLCMALCYGDLLLGMLGITLPMGVDAAYMLFYVLYLVLLFGVEVSFRPRVDTAYGSFYDALKEMGPVPRKTAVPKPQDMPWDAQ